MKERYRVNDLGDSKGLISKWSEKYKEWNDLQTELMSMEEEICNRFAKYKVGEVLRSKDGTKRYVVRQVFINSWVLSNYPEELCFSYVFQGMGIEKDGEFSFHDVFLPNEEELESTGTFINN